MEERIKELEAQVLLYKTAWKAEQSLKWYLAERLLKAAQERDLLLWHK